MMEKVYITVLLIMGGISLSLLEIVLRRLRIQRFSEFRTLIKLDRCLLQIFSTALLCHITGILKLKILTNFKSMLKKASGILRANGIFI